MKVITFNVGLLVYDLIKIPLFIPTPFIKERLKAMPKVFRESEADLICLQEIYHIEHKAYLSEALKEEYPFIYFEHKGFYFSMENGLMIFSKTKLDNYKQVTFKNVRWEEHFFASTGYQKFKLDDVNYYHIHLTAGGLLGPEHNQSELLRNSQLEQLIGDIDQKKSIVLGDFNCGPTVSAGNYQTIIDGGFINLTTDHFTWDPSNPLNINGIHSHCPPQSIDHIMANYMLKSSSRICFDKAIVETKNGRVTLSDHYGVEVEYWCSEGDLNSYRLAPTTTST